MDALPTLEHLLYIPGMLMIGIALGFRFGAKAARDEMARQQKERME